MNKVNEAITNLSNAISTGPNTGIKEYLDPNAEFDLNGVKMTNGLKSLLEFFSANPETMKKAPPFDIDMPQSENGNFLRKYVATLDDGETAEVKETWGLGEKGLPMLKKMIVLGKKGKRKQTKSSALSRIMRLGGFSSRRKRRFGIESPSYVIPRSNFLRK